METSEPQGIVQSIIVAMSLNGCIGKDNALPWHLRDDLLNFKRLTLNKPIIMGRNTYDSIGRPLPERHNIVISRNADLRLEGCTIYGSLAEAHQDAQQWCQNNDCDEYLVIGGAQVYAQCLSTASRLYVTKVDTELQGDAWFPDINWSDWREVSRVEYLKDERNDWNFSILKLERQQ